MPTPKKERADDAQGGRSQATGSVDLDCHWHRLRCRDGGALRSLRLGALGSLNPAKTAEPARQSKFDAAPHWIDPLIAHAGAGATAPCGAMALLYSPALGCYGFREYSVSSST